MDMLDAAMGSLRLASSTQLTQYSAALEKKAMDAETRSAEKMLEMLPQTPQPGSVPSVAKGSFVDFYA